MNSRYSADEARRLLCWSEELLVAVRINKEPTIRAVLAKAKKNDCVQEICAATIAMREVWLDAVSSFPDYPQLLKIGREKGVPIIEAIRNSRMKMVELMLDHGVDVNARPIRTLRTPLEACVTHNKLDILRMLIDKYDASPNMKDPLWQSPIFHALKLHNLEAVDTLLERGADPNAIDSFGHTPLIFFMQDRDLRMLDKDILEHLLDKGADCNLKVQSSGKAALHFIMANNFAPSDIRTMVVEMLLERRADADLTDSNGKSPLHCVCDTSTNSLDIASRCKLVSLLIQYGADPDIQDEDFKTALHLAAENNLPKVVETLTEKNANPKLREINGKRPFDLVSKDSEVASILEEATAKWDKKSEAQAVSSSVSVSSSAASLEDSSSTYPVHSAINTNVPDLVGMPAVSLHLNAKSKRFRTSINRLEDAINHFSDGFANSDLNLLNVSSGSTESGLDEVDGLALPSNSNEKNTLLENIQTEFYKLKTYAYGLEEEVKKITKELERHKNCKMNIDMVSDDAPSSSSRPDSPLLKPKRQETLLFKAVTKVSSLVGHDWKMLMRNLELEDTFEVEIIIKELEDKYRGQLREQGYQALLHWIQRYGSRATFDNLLEALEDCDLVDIRDRLIQLRDGGNI